MYQEHALYNDEEMNLKVYFKKKVIVTYILLKRKILVIITDRKNSNLAQYYIIIEHEIVYVLTNELRRHIKKP